MPAPVFTLVPFNQGQRQSIKFGGYTVPNLGTTAPFTDLNDAVSWFADDFIVDIDRQLVSHQQAWLAKGVWVGEDFGPLTITIPTIFDEGGGQTFAAAKAALLALGEQYLTIDGNLTALLAKCSKVGKPALLGGVQPYRFSTDLEFKAKEPWWKNVSATSSLANSVAGSSGGTTTNLAVTPLGSIFAEPKFVLNIPVGNGVSVTSLKVANLSSGETITVTLAIPASTAAVITIDSSIFKVTNGSGTEYDPLGSFPRLYPGGAQTIAVTIGAGGATTGLTFDIIYTARWIP